MCERREPVNRNHTRKTDDSSVYETGEGSGCSSRVRALTKLGTTQGTLVVVADQLRYATESLLRWVAQAEVDAGDVSHWECQFSLQDALRTRFIENWCKMLQTVEHSKPLLRLGSRVYPPVRGLWRDGLLIRRLEVRVLPGVPR